MNQESDNSENLAKWLAGDLTSDQKSAFESEQNLHDLKAVIDDIDTWSVQAMDVKAKYNELVAKREKSEGAKIISMRPVWRVAAVVALLIISYFGWDGYSNREMSFVTGIGESKIVELPDGSKVHLDANSSLTYSPKIWKNERTVDLSGQAFFAVVKKKKPFKAKSKKGTVKVLGTSFNIEDTDDYHVVCYSGKVLVSTAGAKEILTQGMGVLLEADQLVKTSNMGEQPDWLQGFSEFKNQPLTKVIAELEKYYEVDVQLPKKYDTLQFTGRFVHNDLESALRSIFSPLEITYVLQSDGRVDFP